MDDFEELDEMKKNIAGKIVLYNVPFTTYGETVQYRYDGPNRAAEYGAIASIIRSIGPWSMNTPHTGTMGDYKSNKRSTLFVGISDLKHINIINEPITIGFIK